MKKYQFNVLKIVDSLGKVWLYAKAEDAESGDYTFLKFKPSNINYKRIIPLLIEQLENGVSHTLVNEDIEGYAVLDERLFNHADEVDVSYFCGNSINHTEGNV